MSRSSVQWNVVRDDRGMMSIRPTAPPGVPVWVLLLATGSVCFFAGVAMLMVASLWWP